jgi:hypothetical protein
MPCVKHTLGNRHPGPGNAPDVFRFPGVGTAVREEGEACLPFPARDQNVRRMVAA